MALLAASMLAGTYYTDSRNGRARSERMDPHTPLNTREKQAKNRAKRRRGK
jgi:hypothetical protein